jgi:hypothetical protein
MLTSSLARLKDPHYNGTHFEGFTRAAEVEEGRSAQL